MGKHMDARRIEGKEPLRVEEWKVDEGLEGWLVGCGVLVREGSGRGGVFWEVEFRLIELVF